MPRATVPIVPIPVQMAYAVSRGRVRTARIVGGILNLAFCDVFEMRGGLIGRLTSYIAEIEG